MYRLPPRTCEAKVGAEWRVISLREAKSTYATALQRCPACHGRVFVTGSYTRVKAVSVYSISARIRAVLSPARTTGASHRCTRRR
ncbi:hypothetical protein R1A27_15970 [Methylobacterium sp. NMS12]|uniref:hypothetical protein n=1 Tax=Methylobacterium sp. NMS12 TaxID=3079766 RepID=UPI003F8834C5